LYVCKAFLNSENISNQGEGLHLNLKGFLDGLSQEKYLVYFLLAWAGGLFFWGISGIYWNARYFEDAYDGARIFTSLFDIGAGVMLGLLSARMLNINLIPTLKKEALLTYFLLLWAGTFFFDGIADFVYFGLNGLDIDILGALASLAAGAVLALFAWKLLQSKTSLEEKHLTPISQTL
jgi:hypothetical protein